MLAATVMSLKILYLQVPKGLCVVEADCGRILEGNPESDPRLRHLMDVLRTSLLATAAATAVVASPRLHHKAPQLLCVQKHGH